MMSDEPDSQPVKDPEKDADRQPTSGDNDDDVPTVDLEQLAEDVRAFDHFLELLNSSSDYDDVEPGQQNGNGPPGPGADGAGHDDAATGKAATPPPPKKGKVRKITSSCVDLCCRTKSCAENTFAVVKSDVGLLLLLMVYSCLGAAILNATESGREMELKRDLDACRHETVEQIMNETMRAGRGAAAEAHVRAEVDRLVTHYAGQKESMWPYSSSPGWTYWGALYFCATVFTTVGYGNVYPLTPTGRNVTIVYAAVGIPLCLVVLANMGKTMTRAIKFLWSFVRRFYYTGSFRRKRHMIPLARLRLSVYQRVRLHFRRMTWHRRLAQRARRRHDNDDGEEGGENSRDAEIERGLRKIEEICVPYEVDDNFNLPPIVALAIAFVYMLLGAAIYTRWENWTFAESFYFTFISLSTIGFGDIVPQHPKFFLLTGFYLLLGLALLAMVINVSMVALHGTITKATEEMRIVGQKLADAPEFLLRREQQKLQSAGPPGMFDSPTSDQRLSMLSGTSSIRRRSV